MNMNMLFGCVLVYLLFMVGISVYMSMKKVKSSDDFARCLLRGAAEAVSPEQQD